MCGEGCEVKCVGEMEIFGGIKTNFVLPDSCNLGSR